ncbi:dTDP-4-dehydrorhamnose 3,5-epimerase family protein [Aliikangiella maris]|uniref:dTDP-4-dehydrorhamnose 3,5-epimerase family protein n=2 Tax=Aliikangiella maris TaxID=3162458 RepID=A0ABV2BRR2_9GAMM
MNSEIAEIEYKCSNYYVSEFERTIIWNDPELAIDWSILPDVSVQLSNKDRSGFFITHPIMVG